MSRRVVSPWPYPCPCFLGSQGFSEIIADGVSNGGKFDSRRSGGFQRWIDDHELIDMGFTHGSKNRPSPV